MTAERTLVIFKPDALHRMLVGRILARFEQKGLRIAALKLLRPERTLIERLYQVHAGKPFYAGLVDFMSAGPIVVAVLEGPQAIAVVRRLLGATDGRQATPGTIRGDLGLDPRYNLVHASDGPEAARFETDLFFRPEEIIDYSRAPDAWVASG